MSGPRVWDATPVAYGEGVAVLARLSPTVATTDAHPDKAEVKDFDGFYYIFINMGTPTPTQPPNPPQAAGQSTAAILHTCWVLGILDKNNDKSSFLIVFLLSLGAR